MQNTFFAFDTHQGRLSCQPWVKMSISPAVFLAGSIELQLQGRFRRRLSVSIPPLLIVLVEKSVKATEISSKKAQIPTSTAAQGGFLSWPPSIVIEATAGQESKEGQQRRITAGLAHTWQAAC